MDRQPIRDVNQTAAHAPDRQESSGAIQQVAEPAIAAPANRVADGNQSSPAVEHHEGDGRNRKQRREWGRFFDRLLTVALVGFTGALVYVGELQRRDLVEAGKTSESAAQAANSAAESAAKTAIATDKVAAATQKTSEANEKTATATNTTAAWLSAVAESLKQANATSQQTASAVTSSANTEASALAESRANTVRQMRAFLAVKNTKISTGADHKIIASVDFHNAGITSAKNVTILWAFNCLSDTDEARQYLTFRTLLPAAPQIPDRVFVQQSDLSIGPGVDLQQQREVSMSPEGWNAWTAGSVHCIVRGRLTYTDEFGGEHFTNFHFKEGADLVTNERILLVADGGNDSS